MNSGCSSCSALGVKLDPYSRLCLPCKKHMMIHGSAKIPKPKLKDELEIAHHAVVAFSQFNKAQTVFDRFMYTYSSAAKDDPLRRLAWLQFVHLKTCDGEPLMRFMDVLVQSLAVIIHEQRGGRFDNKKKQYQYCLGRASVCTWNRRRQAAQGTDYDKKERVDLQRRPTLMLRAFNEIFIDGGISRYLAKLTNKIRNKKYDSTEISSSLNG